MNSKDLLIKPGTRKQLEPELRRFRFFATGVRICIGLITTLKSAFVEDSQHRVTGSWISYQAINWCALVFAGQPF